MKNAMVIGIAGGSGSGKTTLTQRIADQFRDNVTVIRHDDYYKDTSGLTYEQRAALNYDCPDAFETDLMVRDIAALKQGIEVYSPVYDYSVHNRSSEKRLVKPTSVIIVEGILIFENKDLRDLMDIKIFVDTDADIRFIRRLTRDVKERARSLDSVISQYIDTVKPMHEMYVETSKRGADLVVLGGGKNMVALDMLTERIKKHIAE